MKKPEKEVERFGFKWYGSGEYAYQRFESKSDGDYIKHADHQKIVDKLNRQIKALNKL